MRPSASVTSSVRALVFAVTLGILAGRADGTPIFTGNGAGAWINAPNQFVEQQGGTPASVSGSATVGYTNMPVLTGDPPQSVTNEGSLTETYSGYAASTPSALGRPLLELRGSASSPNPGDTVGAYSTPTELGMNTYWGGVIAKVGNPAGPAFPDSIRLNFALAYTPPSQIQEANWGAAPGSYTTQTIGLNNWYGTRLTDVGGPAVLPDQGPVTMGADGLLHTTFSMTLPLSNTGQSDVFSITMSSRMAGVLEMRDVDNASAMTLTLNSITLPNGADLEGSGYAIAFESGNPETAPPPVPEPTTWLAWGLIAAGSAWRFRRPRNA